VSDESIDYRLMGVLNVTPDSFSDGGRFIDPDVAVAHGLELLSQGADILDVGGESTRPGADPVSAEDERARVEPVIAGLARAGAQVSVDTSKASVAEAALRSGATLVNDVTALRSDPEMAALIAEHDDVDCCLMHMLGEPRTMQREPRYEEVVGEVKAFLAERIQFALDHGIDERRLLIDPGIGFGKTAAHNLELLRRLDELLDLGPPVVVGTSRKSFLGRLTPGAPGPDERLPGTIATNVLAFERGASVFRVHDVGAVRDALAVTAATLGRRWTERNAETTATT
jgi:dihydropteroate synthase